MSALRVNSGTARSSREAPPLDDPDGCRNAMRNNSDVSRPVELVGLPRREAHRHIGMDRNAGSFVAPSLDEPMHAVVGAVISAPTQLLKQPLGRTAFPLRQLRFLLQNLRQSLNPIAEFGRGLNPALVLELGQGPRTTLRT